MSVDKFKNHQHNYQDLTETKRLYARHPGENLCPEEPVQILYNGHEAATLLCTPLELVDLAVGWLYAQGLIENWEEIHTIGLCEDKSQVFARTNYDRWLEKRGWQKALSSGCGGGAMLVSTLKETIKPVTCSLSIDKEEIRRTMREMLERAEMYKSIGGMHSSALANGKEGILYLSEDIGRHNAVDKVIGKGIINHLNFSDYYLLTTGRISAEIVLKAVRASIAVIASLSIASSLAFDIASLAGITLIGRALSKSPVVYAKVSS
ncbi:MAG: formate dehydrogenase accessory sulfurtransferase FdhD [Candidatus Tectomicrobia bacterium]|uniref:Formate dehydrogenase accessory sulfurtransferase FdhD n=1 Tax=Tectimicrobiota bacterium TaxID=2528274 RepID=A0A933GLR2_UNCTE|nr:formate dehydrogenase accessory sulfurtransferase FdhD [Candidatus Tectomicrobia bacterium]